ncbi:MAG TPA: 7-cyano-7-deazaguanine synthase QueC [Dissulfurispiraceae bacterium]|nr:7-cyano-7-deazaguanine synthase QueC [Dissulfurispiraceae bacterium]
MRRAVVLLSGGVDSSTTLAIAKAEGYELYAITFDYGQRHKIELESAAKVASSLGVKKHLVTRFDMRAIGGSALTDDIDVPKYQKSGVRSRKSEEKQEIIPVTYVPARNTVFLSFALAWSEVLHAQDIFIGANAVDYSGYPDCRPEYLKAFENMANLATKVAVEGMIRFSIRAPLLLLSKLEIIKKGMALGLDYSLTWSCYDPQPLGMDVHGYKACGRCDSCLFRKKGFDEAGIADPAF